MSLIDRNMIHIWIGPKPQPTKWMDTWRLMHPDWKYFVYTDAMYRCRIWKNQHLMTHYYQQNKFNGVADLMRYELLYEMGGFLPPADSICHHSINELLTEDEHFCYGVYENERLRPGLISPIYAANKQNKFVKMLIDELHQLSPNDLSPSPWRSTGNLFIKQMVEKHTPDIKIWPSHYFIPKHHDPSSSRYNGPDKVYADQMWGSTPGGNDYESGRK